jgi:hypothetical protein
MHRLHWIAAWEDAVIYACLFAIISAIAAAIGLLDLSVPVTAVVRSICGVAFILFVTFYYLARSPRSESLTE